MPRKALVVDSDYFFVEFLSALLEKRGYLVRKAYDGKEGIASLEDGPFDILFADLVMPKVSGRQFFECVRRRYNGHCSPLVALSGTLIEQMDDLEGIAADYFIAKGPLEKLEIRLTEFISRLEQHPSLPPAEKKILQTGGVFPRRDAMELLGSLEFYRSVLEAVGVGLVIIDKDTRIINANVTALNLMGTSLADTLNRPVLDAFPPNRCGEVISALKTAGREANPAHCAFFMGLNGRMLRAVVSAVKISGVPAGWVIAFEGASG